MRKLRMFWPVGVGLFTAVVAVALIAVAAAPGTVAPKKVSVALVAGKPTELHFTPSAKAVIKDARPLRVTFTITNRGTVGHNFKIAGKKTLLIAPGKSRPLVVTFTRTGRFQFICTVLGHAAGGMKGTLTVKR